MKLTASGLNSEQRHQRLTNKASPEFQSLPPDDEMVSKTKDYANVAVVSDYFIDAPKKLEESGILDTVSGGSARILEQRLAGLHARMRANDPNVTSDMKKYLPWIARSSDSLDDGSKQMLTDCQQFLEKAFVSSSPSSSSSSLLKVPRSAESSPMTTLQKGEAGSLPLARHLAFSSNSSPSDSFNKYRYVSPPGTMQRSLGLIQKSVGAVQKSISSPTGTIRKNYCSPVTCQSDESCKVSPSEETR